MISPMHGDAYLLVYCACPDEETGKRIASTLVDEALAACVTRLAAASTYRWDGQLEHANETLLLIKTHAATYGALQRRVFELHPYELPEIIAVPISDGLPAYLEWIAASVRRA